MNSWCKSDALFDIVDSSACLEQQKLETSEDLAAIASIEAPEAASAATEPRSLSRPANQREELASRASSARRPRNANRSRKSSDSIDVVYLCLAKNDNVEEDVETADQVQLMISLHCRSGSLHQLSFSLSNLFDISAKGSQLELQLPQAKSSAIADFSVACVECRLEFNRADAAVAHFRRPNLSGSSHQRYKVLLLCGYANCRLLFTNYSARTLHRLRVHGSATGLATQSRGLTTFLAGPNDRLYHLYDRQLVDCGPFVVTGKRIYELPEPVVV